MSTDTQHRQVPARPTPAVPLRNWRHQAACRDEDPETFFPVGSAGPALAQIAAAKTVCRGCTVAAVCRQWALDARVDHGVWGGLAEEERRALRYQQYQTVVAR